MTSRALEEPRWVTPTALGFSRGDVTALAVSVAQKLGYHAGDDLEPLICRMGGSVEYSDSEQSESGSIKIWPNRFVIYLSLTTSLLRDRFTIAHELGHYVLHYIYPNQHSGADIKHLRAERFGSGDAENEANWFAAAFLMPPDQFRSKYDELKGNHILLAHHFKVSQPASEVRARSLGLPASNR